MEQATETDKAAILLERELDSVRHKFENGNMTAFGIG